MVKQLLDDIYFVRGVTKEELIELTQVCLIAYKCNDDLKIKTNSALNDFIADPIPKNSLKLQKLLVALHYRKGGC